MHYAHKHRISRSFDEFIIKTISSHAICNPPYTCYQYKYVNIFLISQRNLLIIIIDHQDHVGPPKPRLNNKIVRNETPKNFQTFHQQYLSFLGQTSNLSRSHNLLVY